MNTYIGIDLGTSSVKLLLVSADGKVLNSVTKEYPIYYPRGGWSEQNPEDWLEATQEGLKELLEDKSRADVKGLSFGGQMHGLVLLDDEGNVIQKKYIDVKFVLDERICDGYYYATFFKYFRSLMRHPEVLDNPPEVVNQDIP